MRRPSLLVAAAVLSALAGCAHEVQVVSVDPAKKCEPGPTVLQACERPAPLATDLTYGQLLDSYQADRERLRRCAAQRDDLAKALELCNGAIDQHNAELAQRLKGTPPK